MHVLGLAIAWEALFVFDVMIVVLTLASAYRTKSLNQKGPRDLASLIVRDGESVLYVGSRAVHQQSNHAGMIYFVCVAYS